MKKLVVRIFVFFLFVAFLDFLFGFCMRRIMATTEKGDWGRRNYIVNNLHDDILIFGSSRALHHYDPSILVDSLQLSCYNCAEDGNGILSHYPRIEMILERYSPRIIVYDLIPKYDFLTYDNASFLGLLRPYSDNEAVSSVILDIDKRELLKLHSSFYKYNSAFVEMIMQRFSRSATTAKDFTYMPLVKELDYDPGDPGDFEGGSVDEIKFKYLREMVDICHSHNVELFFVTSPWYKMKSSTAYDPICKLCEEKGVPFLNHNFDEDYNLNRSYFHDPAHLNKVGAEVFSALVAHEIKARY